MPPGIPKFADLPLSKNDPPHSAWGLYGKDDELGMLNRLTDDVVLEAAKEIKTGKRVSLNLPMDALGDIPLFGRQVFNQNMYAKVPRCVNDDIWTFNTQSSSQWDGLRHFGYQKERKFYNGVTMDDIHAEPKSTVLGIQAWSKHGIVGRGILLDYASWREAQRPIVPHEPFQTGSIKLEHLKAVAAAQGTDIRFGDILIIRSGFTKAFLQLDRAGKKALAEQHPPGLAGVEQSEAVLEWIWDHFSAVAADHPSFECWPTQMHIAMHEVLLGGWGCPIGELFDLEALSEMCKQQQRWSFFMTSEVCNVPGGVASPPNVIAIF